MGATGQDGAHIAEHLTKAGWDVYGGFRRGGANTWRLEYLGLIDKIKLLNIKINEPFNLMEVFRQVEPDCIYHFAGESFVADSFVHPVTTFETNTLGTLYVLEAMRTLAPSAKLFFASSSEIFNNEKPGALLDEKSALQPTNPYGLSKMTAHELVRMYRDTYGLHASVGIMFNHEGPLRAKNFVTRKITSNLARLKMKGGEPVELGDFDSSRDWGSAEDYTKAMIEVLELDCADDYVFATGKLKTLRQFLSAAATAAGFDPVFEGADKSELCIDKLSGMPLAKVSNLYIRAHDTTPRCGNSKKLQQKIDWKGSRAIEMIASEMVYADIARWKDGVRNI